MKAFGISLLLSAFLFSLFGVAGKMYGFHSTPGIWLAFVNLPGILCAVWIQNWIGFCVAITVNSMLYACLFQILRLFRK